MARETQVQIFTRPWASLSNFGFGGKGESGEEVTGNSYPTWHNS